MLDINIDDTGVCTLRYKQKNRMNTTKRCSIETLSNLFSSRKKVTTPILPFGTRKYEVMENGEHRLMIEIPPGIRRVKYVKSHEANTVLFEGEIMFPPTLLIHNLRNSGDKYVVTNTKIFALKRPLISMDDCLYKYPAPNTYSDDRVCWGGASELLTFNSLAELGRSVDIFFSGVFNTDLHPRINGYRSIQDYWKELEESKVYNYDVLVKSDHSISKVMNDKF